MPVCGGIKITVQNHVFKAMSSKTELHIAPEIFILGFFITEGIVLWFWLPILVFPAWAFIGN